MLNVNNPNRHTIHAIILLLRDGYSTMNEESTSELDNHTNIVVLVKYSSILRIHYFQIHCVAQYQMMIASCLLKVSFMSTIEM